MTKTKIKDILARTSKTFVQAFLGSLTIDSFLGVTDATAIKRIGLSVLVGAVSAGVCAVWNMIIDFATQWVDKKFPVFIPETEGIEDESEITFETQIEADENIVIETEETENV